MKKICLQVGHQNIKFNEISALQGSTGAPQEMGTNYKITSRLAEILRSKGFEVKQTDANANSDPTVTDVDYDLFLAIHCDADSALLSGGFIDTADPVVDMVPEESTRIALAIESEYFEHSGIVNRPERKGKSDGVLLYYMWATLTANTPCVLIEMGESIDAHDRVILNDTERVANALARGICKAFGVAFDSVLPSPTEDTITISKTEYVGLKTQITSLTEKVEKIKTFVQGV
jgi:N-acetylmuramoyl-L-alanine amidase